MSYPTWSDLNNESIVPPLGARKASNIGSVALMVSCEPDIKLIKSGIPNLTASAFFTSTLMTCDWRDKGISIVGPFIGSPYAVMILESLIAKGATRIIVSGWCGAVTDEFEVGDIILPNKAIIDEGTSINYKKIDSPVPASSPDSRLLKQFSSHLTSQDIQHNEAAIWTTDAIYRETEKKVTYFRKAGASAVEMECSALFSVGEYRDIQILAVLVVSDSVSSKDWKPGFKNKRFKSARNAVCNAITTFAQKLCENE